MAVGRKRLTCYFPHFTTFRFMYKERLALSICKTLQSRGYLAYFAGGYVRDMILKIESDDIDIATDAPPQVIQSLFEKTIPVGIAFGIVVVVLEGTSFEVATFRKDLAYKDGRRPDEIAFSSPEEDAQRRDFTINGMFYDPIHKKVMDYVEGEQDLENHLIKAIGDPIVRFTEDRLRMIRACRFAARFGFQIEEATKKAILSKAHELFPSVSIERVYQEFQKMQNHRFEYALLLLFEMKLLQEIFPKLKQLSIEQLKQYLTSFKFMPIGCPTILYLLELFPEFNTEEVVEMGEYLKISNAHLQVALDCQRVRSQVFKELTKYEWVKMYAMPNIELSLKIIAARLPALEQSEFFEQHVRRQQQLEEAINRRILNKPIVSSQFLMEQGIKPGKELGQLLEKAEAIAVEHDIHNAHQVLQKLIQFKDKL